MKTILDLSNVKAYQYFMEPENYCNVSFPVYISFKKILEYVERTVGNNELKAILKDSKKKPSAFENVNHTILIKKRWHVCLSPNTDSQSLFVLPVGKNFDQQR